MFISTVKYTKKSDIFVKGTHNVEFHFVFTMLKKVWKFENVGGEF